MSDKNKLIKDYQRATPHADDEAHETDHELTALDIFVAVLAAVVISALIFGILFFVAAHAENEAVALMAIFGGS